MDVIIDGFNNLMSIREFETFFKLVLIVFLSGFVGWERESWSKPAGFRTHVLVGISAVLLMVCGEFLYEKTGSDPTRIPAQLLSGIGFLGAGTILRDGNNVKGLTTAAGLLSVTCIGLAVGAGYYLGAIIATAVVYVVLSYSHILSNKFEHYNFLNLRIITKKPKLIFGDVKDILKHYDLDIYKVRVFDNKKEDKINLTLKYRSEINLNVNEIISQIIEINEVIEVEEVKQGQNE